MKRLATLLGIASILMFITPAYATVLLFEPAGVNGADVSQDYGDRVTSTDQGGFIYGDVGGFTPNVTVAYGPDPTQIHRWGAEFGDLQNVIYNDEDLVGIVEITLTADANLQVTLDSFDLAGWSNADYTIDSVQVLDATGGPLFSDTDVLIQGDFDGPRHTSFVFDPPLISQEMTIRFDASNLGNGSDNIGIDNITFGQVGFGLTAPDPGGADMENTFSATGATPGQTVHFIFGTNPGSTDVPGCPGKTVGLGNPQVIDTAVADVDGNATITKLIPANAAGVTVGLHAVELANCLVSNMVVHTFE